MGLISPTSSAARPVMLTASPKGREACRSAGAGADQVRASHQPQNRQGTWPRGTSDAARPRRRGDRMKRRVHHPARRSQVGNKQASRRTEHLQRGESPMLKTVAMSSLAIALGVAAWLLPMRGEQATAQSGPLRILVVEYDIVPAEIDKYLTAIKELGAAAVKEPGCRQLSIAVSQKDPNHVLLFEAWDNAAALDAFSATQLFKKYPRTVGNIIPKLDIRTYSSVAMNFKGN